MWDSFFLQRVLSACVRARVTFPFVFWLSTMSPSQPDLPSYCCRGWSPYLLHDATQQCLPNLPDEIWYRIFGLICVTYSWRGIVVLSTAPTSFLLITHNLEGLWMLFILLLVQSENDLGMYETTWDTSLLRQFPSYSQFCYVKLFLYAWWLFVNYDWKWRSFRWGVYGIQ